jgi:iron complex transport system substrate-binding protein
MVIDNARQRLDQIGQNTSPKRLLLLEWIDPPYSPGHWVPEQVEAAGITSVLGEPGDHSRALHWAEIQDAAPDAIGVICCGYGLDENVRFAQQIATNPELSSWFTGPIVAFDANRFFSRPTLSVIDGAVGLHQAFIDELQVGDGFRRIRNGSALPS